MCVIILGTFLCRPLQNNNVKMTKFCGVHETWTTLAFRICIWKLNAVVAYLAVARF